MPHRNIYSTGLFHKLNNQGYVTHIIYERLTSFLNEGMYNIASMLHTRFIYLQ